MNTFIYRIIVFFTIGFFIVAGYHYAIYRLALYDTSHYKIKNNVLTVVIGDSHTETSINDSQFNNLQNYSYKGESIFLSYYKLKQLLDINPEIKNVLLAFSYHSLNKFQDDKLQPLLYDYYWLLDKEGFQQVTFSLDNLNMILKNMNGRLYQWLISIIKGEKYHLLTGGYRKLEVDKLSEESSQKRILKHYFKKDEKTTQKYSALQTEYFNKIIQLCADKNIKLSFINTPLHPSYYNNIPQQYIVEYYARIDNIKNKRPNLITLFDFKNLINTDELFHDGDHLNGEGGKYFMRALNKKLLSQIKNNKSGNNHH